MIHPNISPYFSSLIKKSCDLYGWDTETLGAWAFTSTIQVEKLSSVVPVVVNQLVNDVCIYLQHKHYGQIQSILHSLDYSSLIYKFTFL